MFTVKLYGRLSRAAEKRNAAPGASSAIEKGARLLTEDGDGTQASDEERSSALSEQTLWGARRKGLATAAPIPKAGAGRDASGARPIWAAISASLGKTTPRYPSSHEML